MRTVAFILWRTGEADARAKPMLRSFVESCCGSVCDHKWPFQDFRRGVELMSPSERPLPDSDSDKQGEEEEDQRQSYQHN